MSPATLTLNPTSYIKSFQRPLDDEFCRVLRVGHDLDSTHD